jgi:membrane protease YdiL (CAAX protease family)
MLTDESKRRRSTWIGLAIALFGLPVSRQAVTYFYPTLTFSAAIWKESLIWICAIALLILIRRGEGLPLTSIGIGTSRWWKSVLWGLLIAVVCAVVGGLLAALTKYGHGESAEAFSKLPTWLIAVICVRAGIVEELFYRGYAIERLQMIGMNKYVAAAIPLIIFSVGHWTGGWANIVIALALGAILAAFYLWKRDLVANMIAHFTVDFVANVLPKMFS